MRCIIRLMLQCKLRLRFGFELILHLILDGPVGIVGVMLVGLNIAKHAEGRPKVVELDPSIVWQVGANRQETIELQVVRRTQANLGGREVEATRRISTGATRAEYDLMFKEIDLHGAIEIRAEQVSEIHSITQT